VDNTLDQFGQVIEIALKCTVGEEIERDKVEIEIDDKSKDDTVNCLDEHLYTLCLLNTISGSISCLFLAITFLVYILVPEFDNLHGKIVLSNVASIFFLTFYLLLVYNFSYYLPQLVCQIVGYSGYFFTMAMFSWMTIMSFDMCWTFIRAKVPRRGSALVKFVIYSAVAWGSSAAFTFGTILVDHFVEDQNDQKNHFFAKPNVGKWKCFLEDKAQGLFLHLPSMILMLINVIFFLITTSTLYRY
jgi:G protein-coupled receptor Mth (Methuselah protein)